jgi:hypothetical protein
LEVYVFIDFFNLTEDLVYVKVEVV